MNAAHVHLLINHLPIFATLLALPVALYGMWASATPHVLRISAYLLLAGAFGAGVSMRSGEEAEDLIEPMEHVETTQIHEHSEQAHRAAPVALGAAALAIAATITDTFSQGRRRRAWQLALLIAAALSSILLAETGLSGGKIQHREVREGYDPSAPVTPEAPLDL